ncbi:glycosyltransferase family 2 protein [Candidatus Woesearchaeota archaeon]|nr:glycosyltransferase family 2 protein [Candidatus Woesearchaeota archaeon]
MKTTVDIVVPVYNEQNILEKSISTLCDFLEKNFKHSWSIIIADNASIDRTLEIANSLAKKYKKVKVLHLNQKGRGRALRIAWTKSDADIVSYMDVDLSTDLSFFPVMVDSLLQGYDVATGSRLMEGAEIKRSFKRELLSRGYNVLVRLILGVNYKDSQCGFKAVKREIVNDVVPEVRDNAWFFDSELLFRAHMKGYKIKEIPVKWIEDEDSRVRIFSTVTNYLKSIAILRLEYLFKRRRKR